MVCSWCVEVQQCCFNVAVVSTMKIWFILKFSLWCVSGMTLVVDNSAPAQTAASSFRRPYRRYRRRYPRRRSVRKRRMTFRTRARRPRRRVHHLSKFVLANIDPFNVDCVGAKIPDSNTFPSHGFRVDDSLTGVAADANGLRAYAFLPTLKNQFVSHTAASASTWTWSAAYGGGTDSTRLSAIDSGYELFRPVAHGVKISCPGAPTAVTGNVHVAIVAVSEWGATTWAFPTSISMMSNGMFYRKYPLAQFTQQSLSIVNKFLDVTSSRYIDPSSDGIGPTTNDNNLQTNGWAAIVIVVEGAGAGNTVLEVENVLHIEAIPKKDGISVATPAAPYSVTSLEETSRMAGETPAAFADTERSEYMSEVTSALSRGARSAFSSAFRNIVVPGAYRVGQYAAGRAIGGIMGVTNFRTPSVFETIGY